MAVADQGEFSVVKNHLCHRCVGAPGNIFDFVQRVNLTACNRKNIENLALAGAFDGFTGIKREDFFVKNAKDETFVEVLVRYGGKYQLDKAEAANSLFGGDNQVEIAILQVEKNDTIYLHFLTVARSISEC